MKQRGVGMLAPLSRLTPLVLDLRAFAGKRDRRLNTG